MTAGRRIAHGHTARVCPVEAPRERLLAVRTKAVGDQRVTEAHVGARMAHAARMAYAARIPSHRAAAVRGDGGGAGGGEGGGGVVGGGDAAGRLGGEEGGGEVVEVGLRVRHRLHLSQPRAL